jgi:hypothetical protein
LVYGETLSREIAGVTAQTSFTIIRLRAGWICPVREVSNGGSLMDLAMIMGVTLFAMFTGSTVYFLYKVPR